MLRGESTHKLALRTRDKPGPERCASASASIRASGCGGPLSEGSSVSASLDGRERSSPGRCDADEWADGSALAAVRVSDEDDRPEAVTSLWRSLVS